MEEMVSLVKKHKKPRSGVQEFLDVPRGFRPVRLPDGQIMLMKHEHLYPEKVQCECGVRVSAVECALALEAHSHSISISRAER